MKFKEWTDKRDPEKEIKSNCSVWARAILYNNGAGASPGFSLILKELSELGL